MKKLSILILSIFIVISCTKEHSKEYISISGKIENNKDSLLTISARTGVLKTITINSDGSFKDTLKVEKADVYLFQLNKSKRTPIYLKNGYDLTVNINDNATSNFEISGIGADNSNLIIAQMEKSNSIENPQAILDLDKDAFDKKINRLKSDYDSILNSYPNLDSSLSAMANQQVEQLISYFKSTYNSNAAMKKGMPSPKFENYVDIKGGTKSLDSFKGKYVYIDVWATWCGPCIVEIPYLQKLEKEYHSKNIQFVSISTDENSRSGGSWEAAEKKWRDFVKRKQMSGVQLWSGKDFSFQQAYNINTIPRFILIDPQGNIVTANAPRPSDPSLKTLLTSLGL